MKNLVGTICFASMFFGATSQVVVTNENMNIVYAGVPNPISFAATGYKTENLILVASCGELARKEDSYNWTICGPYKFNTVIFSCYYQNGGTKKLIGTAEYRIKSPPDPAINFGFNEYLKLQYLSPNYFPALASKEFELNYTIKEFEIVFCRNTSDTLKLKNTGHNLSPEVVAAIGKLQEGDCFCFRNFIVLNECELIDRHLKDAACFHYTKTAPPPGH